MDAPGRAAVGSRGPGDGVPRDGAIDFARYSDSQLEKLRYTLDRERFPQNHAHTLAEIERRSGRAIGPAPHIEGVPGRFSRRDGLRGWLEAKVNRSPLYGNGSLELAPDGVVLDGWQRTWLGAALNVRVVCPNSRIRNVATDGGLVRFELQRGHLPAQRVIFSPASPACTRHLVERLPVTTTPGFEQHLDAVRDFNARLRQVIRRPVVTWGLIAANILTFVCMSVANKSLSHFTPVQIIGWGADFGPLTVNGQWWRLLSALFVHLDPMHLLLNMWALWNIGRLSEQLFGRWTFAFVYFASGLLAGVASIAWNPDGNTAGASGAIFGCLGAFLAFFLNRRNRVPAAIARRHWIGTALFVIFNLLSGALNPGIDNAAHVGGLVAGLALGWILARPLPSSGRHDGRSRRSDLPRH